MTVGRFIDDASQALKLAAARIEAGNRPGPYDATAAVAARDQLYQQLGRLLHLVTAEPMTKPRPAMADAVALLGSDGGRPFTPTTLLAKGIAAATLDLPRLPHGLLMAEGTAAAAIQSAAQSLSFAAEIVATHRHPTSGQSPFGQQASPRFLTREGQALARGAQHRETTGEIARIALAANAIDSLLLAWRPVHPDVLDAADWDVLAQWTASSFPLVLADLAGTRRALLLRQLAAAPSIDRSSGPRDIRSWADAIKAVESTRSALRRERGIGVVAIAAAAARLGFGVTAAGWRLSGRSSPSPLTQANGDRWRALSHALQQVADTRDALALPFVSELDRAKRWIRESISARTTPGTAKELNEVIQLEQHIHHLCRDLAEPIRRANVAGHLLTSTIVMNTVAESGIVMAIAGWARPGKSDPQLSEVMQALQNAAESRPSWGLRTTLSNLMDNAAGPAQHAGAEPAESGATGPAIAKLGQGAQTVSAPGLAAAEGAPETCCSEPGSSAARVAVAFPPTAGAALARPRQSADTSSQSRAEHERAESLER